MRYCTNCGAELGDDVQRCGDAERSSLEIHQHIRKITIHMCRHRSGG